MTESPGVQVKSTFFSLFCVHLDISREEILGKPEFFPFFRSVFAKNKNKNKHRQVEITFTGGIHALKLLLTSAMWVNLRRKTNTRGVH